MTKSEIIARYGEAHYRALIEKTKAAYRANREARLAYGAQRRALMQPVLSARSKASQLKRPEYYKQKSREYTAQRWEAMSPEEQQALRHKYYQNSKSKRDADPDLAAKHYAERKAYHAAWREKNREHVREARARWVAENPDLVKAIAVAAAQNHRFKVNVWSRNNKERRRQAGSIDAKLVLMLKSQPCIDCGATEMIEVGHVIPVKLGGTNDPANLIPQCRSCNRRLSSRPHRSAEKV